jgi:pantoate--beta-alanine ligase
VVLKLFGMVRPDVAYFGQKDYQQVQVVRQMIDDLNVPVKLRVCPTVREPDGLAMSSRNRYLTPAQRQQAVVLWKSLVLAGQLVQQGQRDAGKIVEQMRAEIAFAAEADIDYVALVDPQTFAPVSEIRARTLAVLAVRIGATRLIDNQILEPR